MQHQETRDNIEPWRDVYINQFDQKSHAWALKPEEKFVDDSEQSDVCFSCKKGEPQAKVLLSDGKIVVYCSDCL